MAGVATELIWPIQPAPVTPGAAPNPTVIVTGAPVLSPPNRPVAIPEVDLYTWANEDVRRPETAANAMLQSRTRSGKRLAAVEILALDLANSAPGLAGELEPLALLHPSAPGGRSRLERHARRPRATTPGT